MTIGERSARFRAEPLDGAERNAAITGLILRYGTPSEGLGPRTGVPPPPGSGEAFESAAPIRPRS